MSKSVMRVKFNYFLDIKFIYLVWIVKNIEMREQNKNALLIIEVCICRVY